MSKYRLTLPMVKLYYNILGLDESEVNYDDIQLDVKMIEDISPIKKFNLTDMFSYQLDDNMILLLEKLCSKECEYNHNKQKEYLESINIILKAISNLNLIKEDSQDFILYFKRLSYLLIIVLYELNAMSIESTIKLKNAIKDGSYNSIDEFSYIVPNTSYILLLSMNPQNIKDYEIYGNEKEREFVLGKYDFKDGKVNLKLGEVLKLVTLNKWDVSDIKFDDSPFKRLPFNKALQLTKF